MNYVYMLLYMFGILLTLALDVGAELELKVSLSNCEKAVCNCNFSVIVELVEGWCQFSRTCI